MRGFWILSVVSLMLFLMTTTNLKDGSMASNPTDAKLSIKKIIIREAKRQGLDPILALSVVRQESAFNHNAISPVGAIGLFQLMPGTARDLGVNPHQVHQNIRGGIKYLSALQKQFGSVRLALAAYNAGPGNVQRYGGIPPFRETNIYVRNIMRFYNDYKANPDSIF